MIQTKEMWVMSVLSDAQEMVMMGFDREEVRAKIDQAKKVLLGKYRESEDGFTIEVI